MKKSLFGLSALALCFLVSCADKKTETSTTSEKSTKNLENYNSIVKMFEAGDWSKCDSFIAADAIDHNANMMTGADIVGIDSIKANFNHMGAMIGDMKNKIIKQLADDDYVMSWIEQTGTAKMDAPEMGMKKGVASTSNAVDVVKFKDGKISEHWSFMNMAEMMKMMGGGHEMAPTTNPPMVKDSTSK